MISDYDQFICLNQMIMANTNYQEHLYEKQYLEIEDFVYSTISKREDNKPLTLVFDNDKESRHFVTSYMKYHQKQSQEGSRNIIIPYFTSSEGAMANYCQAIYNFIVKLRERLNINQKVELVEEKLRKYFPYQLEICHETIKQQVFEDVKIILIIEGVDRFRDQETNKQDSIALWLPKYFPQSVRVILTANKTSHAVIYLESTGCQMMQVQRAEQIPENSINDEERLIDDLMLQYVNDLGISKQFREELMQRKSVYMQLLKENSDQYYLQAFKGVFLPDLNALIEKYDVHPYDIYQGDDHEFKVKNSQVMKKLLSLYSQLAVKSLKLDQNVNSIYQLFVKLGEAVIQNGYKVKKFLNYLQIVQKGLNKYELVQLLKIEEYQLDMLLVVFDKIILYHKGIIKIDDYYARIYLKKSGEQDQDEVIAILKEDNINLRKLEEITYLLYEQKKHFVLKEVISNIEHFLLLFNQNSKFQLCRYWQKLEEMGFDPVSEYNKSIEGFEMHFRPKSEDMFKIIFQLSRFFREFSDFETNFTPKFRHPPVIDDQKLDKIGLLVEIKGLKLNYDENKKILNETEQLNIDIPINYQQFRSKMKDEIQGKVYQEQKDESENQLFKPIDIGEDSEDELEKLKKNNIKNKYLQLISADFNVQGETQYYYYKRWLWIIFPWACLSFNKNFSEIIQKFYSSATKYMNVHNENKIYKKAIKTALENKINKKMMYVEKGNRQLQEQIDILKIVNNQIYDLENGDKQEKAFNDSDFDQDVEYIKKQINSYYRDKMENNTSSKDNAKEQNNSKRRFRTEENTNLISTINNTQESELFLTADNQTQNDSTYFPKLNTNMNMSINKQNKSRYSLIMEQQMNATQLIHKSRMQKENMKQYRVDQTLIKNNIQSNNSILPKLQKNIYEHTDNEIKVMLGQQKMLLNQYNKIKYFNQNLQQKLKSLQNQTYGFSSIDKDSNENKMIFKQKIENVQIKIQNLENKHEKARQQKDRVVQIITICQINKNQNEEWIAKLNYLVQNLKKMINIEQNMIKKDTEDIKRLQKINRNYVDQYYSRVDNHQSIVDQIKSSLQNKIRIDEKFLYTDNIIEESINNEVLKMNQDMKEKQAQEQSKKKKELNIKIQEKLHDRLTELIQQKKKLEGVMRTDLHCILESEKFQAFKDKHQNIQQKKYYNMDLQNQKQILLKKKDKLIRELEMIDKCIELQNDKYKLEPVDVKKENKAQIQQELSKMTLENEEGTRSFIKGKHINLSCLMLCNQIFKQLKNNNLSYQKKHTIANDAISLKEFNYQFVIEDLKQKMENIKQNLGEKVYQDFYSNKLDIIDFFKGKQQNTEIQINVSNNKI